MEEGNDREDRAKRLDRLAAEAASRFVERDAQCSSVRLSNPNDRGEWVGVVLVGDTVARKATCADALWTVQCAVREGMGLLPPPGRESEDAAMAPHMFKDEDLLEAYVDLRASSAPPEKAARVKKELLQHLGGTRSR